MNWRDRLGCEGTGEDDLLAEARALGAVAGHPRNPRHGRGQGDPPGGTPPMADGSRPAVHHRRSRNPPEVDGATISITHALVELVLADTEHNVAGTILPDSGVALQRSTRISRTLCSPSTLRRGRSDRCEHHRQRDRGGHRARLVPPSRRGGPTCGGSGGDRCSRSYRTGDPVANDLDWPGAEFDDEETPRKKIPVWMIGAAAGCCSSS